MILIKKISICQTGMVHEGWQVNSPTSIGNLQASTICWRESARRVQSSSDKAAADRVRCLTRTLRCMTSCSVGKTSQNASINSWDFAWNWHSSFKCTQDNSPWSPVQILQTTSCSAVVWSQWRRPSHSLITTLSSAINLVILVFFSKSEVA